jgi:GAF domain-containing protein
VTHTRLAVEAPAKDARRLETGSALLESAQSRNIVKISADDAPVRRSHFLSGISTGLIIPLASTTEVFGLLDIQSTSGISERDEETIKLLALQLGANLAHLRLVDALRQEVKDQQDIVLRQRDRLRQFEREDRQAILSAWGNYMRERGEAILGFDLDEKHMSMVPAAEVDESIRQALQNGEVVTQEQGEIHRVSVPVLLRGQVLGAVAIDLPATRPLTRRQTEMIVSVVQRLALALDNKRLFEQSQAQAQRESKASEIASLLISSTSVETVLELAADSFNDALGAIQTHIRISGTPERVSQPEESQ